jgi:tRNA dimethylallyltransferase
MNSLVCIVGPTGAGKTMTALQISRAFTSEIVNCDSRQIYRHMDIGTAKPTREELSMVMHHLIDIADPDDEISLTQYQEMAYRAINEIQSRGVLPLLVGGTGQYFWAVAEGWQAPKVPPDTELRHNLEKQVKDKGASSLYDELSVVDPAAARKIDPRNIRRVIRALEVFRIRGVRFSELQDKKPPPYRILIVGLTADRQELYLQVDKRVDQMIGHGLVSEVKQLIEMGYGDNLPSMSSIGYRQICRYLRGELTLEEATQQIKFETHRYIRQQYTWFRLKDERIHWFNICNNVESDIIDLINQFIGSSRDERNI